MMQDSQEILARYLIYCDLNSRFSRAQDYVLILEDFLYDDFVLLTFLTRLDFGRDFSIT